MGLREPEVGKRTSKEPGQPSQWPVIILVVMAASVSGLVLCAALLWLPRAFPPYIERHDYAAVAKAFFRALLSEDYQTAASLTLVDQQPRLAEWMTARQPFECPFRFSLDDMEGEVYGAVGGRVDGSLEASYSWSYACTHEDYYFAVDDIALALGSDNEWKVVSWKVCEKRRDSKEICDD